MTKKVWYFIVLFVFVLLSIIDLILIVCAVFGVKENIAGTITALVISLPFVYLTVKCFLYVKNFNNPKQKQVENIDKKDVEPVVENNIKPKKKKSDIFPDYEIRYRSSEGEETVRQIKVIDFKGRMLEALCFLRHEKRTFLVSRIVECVDLSTSEVISGDLHFYFNEKFRKNYNMSTMFSFDEWVVASFVNVPEFPSEIDGFDVDETFNMKIVDLDDGIVDGDFVCGKIRSSLYNENQFYVSLRNLNGKTYNVDLGKILFVKGIENFGEFLINKFLKSDSGKACLLLKKFYNELLILTYLGRADSSITPKKRSFICEYLNIAGADCNDDILVKVLRRVKVDLNEFKKAVSSYSLSIPDNLKKDFLRCSESIIGGREKAKPFGLAGLQYIDSKIRC